jgi:hypothetical protein
MLIAGRPVGIQQRLTAAGLLLGCRPDGAMAPGMRARLQPALRAVTAVRYGRRRCSDQPPIITVIGRLSLSSSSLTTELPPAGEPVSRRADLRAEVRIALR